MHVVLSTATVSGTSFTSCYTGSVSHRVTHGGSRAEGASKPPILTNYHHHHRLLTLQPSHHSPSAHRSNRPSNLTHPHSYFGVTSHRQPPPSTPPQFKPNYRSAVMLTQPCFHMNIAYVSLHIPLTPPPHPTTISSPYKLTI